MISPKWLTLLVLTVPLLVQGELVSLDEEQLATVGGQGGVALSGSFSINPVDGPQWSKAANGSCTTGGTNSGAVGTCGARFAIQFDEDTGYIILDDIQGAIAFGSQAGGNREMEIRAGSKTQTINGEDVTKEVLSLGLSDVLKYDDFGFTLGASTQSLPDAGAQTNLLSINIDGEVRGQGNLLVFPATRLVGP